MNTGRSVSLSVTPDKSVQISGGPLSYHYTLSNITLHFGRENNRGSEHTINGVHFSGELQLYAYNGQLYSNWSEAKWSPNGLIAIAVLIKLSKNSNSANSQLKVITNSLKNITNRGIGFFFLVFFFVFLFCFFFSINYLTKIDSSTQSQSLINGHRWHIVHTVADVLISC